MLPASRLAVGTVALLATLSPPSRIEAAEPPPVGEVVFEETFDDATALDRWATELEAGGEVTVEDGRLIVDVPRGATVWVRQPFDGSVRIEYDVTALSQGGANDRASDLNCFWMATDSRGDFFDVGRGGKFSSYHALRCYYVGFGGNDNTTTRFRRYIGDEDERPLLPEHDLAAPRIEANRTYRVALTADGSRVAFDLDGERIFELHDPDPYTSGHFGLRTVSNRMAVDNIRVRRLP